MARAHRVYRGVKIFRTRIMDIGADYDFNDNGIEIKRKPKPDDFTISYHYQDGPHCDSLPEVKDFIDGLIEAVLDFCDDEKDAANQINFPICEYSA